MAAVHRRAFPEAILTRLGHEPVRRYYEWLLTGPHDAHLLGAFEGGTLVGYCFGGRFHGSLTGFLREHPAHLAWRLAVRPSAVLEILRRFSPAQLARLTRAVLRFRAPRPGTPPAAVPDPKTFSFGILAIAVDPVAHGRGVGRALMERSEEEALRRGYRWMHLTVHPGNRPAVRFYEKQGWTPAGDPWEGRMTKRIGDRAPR